MRDHGDREPALSEVERVNRRYQRCQACSGVIELSFRVKRGISHRLMKARFPACVVEASNGRSFTCAQDDNALRLCGELP